jgi:hypothetical protein
MQDATLDMNHRISPTLAKLGTLGQGAATLAYHPAGIDVFAHAERKVITIQRKTPLLR